MKTVKIDEYLVVNSKTGGRKWLQKMPTRSSIYDIIIHVKGSVKYPEPVYTVDFGEISIEEAEAHAEASMG